MKTLKRPLVLASTLIALTLLLSWNLLNDRDTTSYSSLSHSGNLNDAAMYDEFIAGDGTSPKSNQAPVAEDVLVQRIPGGNSHLLLMAYYSKENYSGQSLTINNGFTIVLRDDGKDDDKIAGDGLYTAKIPADIDAFRSEASGILRKMKAGKYAPLCYLDRQRMIDSDAPESFDIAKFDANQPVSITGLTNALSADFRPSASAQTSKSANSTATGGVVASTTLTATAALTSTATTLDSIKKNSILITDLGVVEDITRTWNYCTQKGNVNGSWTFGSLMRQIASKKPTQIATDSAVSVNVKNWLQLGFAVSHTMNGDPVPAPKLVNNIIFNPGLVRVRRPVLLPGSWTCGLLLLSSWPLSTGSI